MRRITCILISLGGTFSEVDAVAEHSVGRQTRIQTVIGDRLQPGRFRSVKKKVLVDFTDQTLVQLAATYSERIVQLVT